MISGDGILRNAVDQIMPDCWNNCYSC